ncbi:MAG: biopolymer transporter ExbD [Planctomycetota bacterium]|nr:biopolymer transporter ExbD [Planctomycetota bacterium]
MTESRDTNKPGDLAAAAVVAGSHAEGHETHGKRKKHKVSIKVAALNITSFMDLTFNLLLFFVLTASFSIGEGVVPADLPVGSGGAASAATTAPPMTPLVISLRTFGSLDKVVIQFENISIDPPKDFEALYDVLSRMQDDPAHNRSGQYSAKNPIIIKPDRGVMWNHVVGAFNAIVRARYSNVSFAALPEN